jgi:hypothetical protein
MRKPKWLRIKVDIDIKVKTSTVLWLLHWAGWVVLITHYVLTRGQGSLPVL